MTQEISEFAGEDGRTGLPKKRRSQLTASQKLQLGYRVGREDPDAEPDRAAFLGNKPTR